MKLRTYATTFLLLAAAAAGALAPTASAGVDIKPAKALQTLFDSYGDGGKSDRWTGGPTVQTITLPDGRTAWSMARTYLGTVAPNRSRDEKTPFVNNSFILQDKKNGKLSKTLLGPANTDFYPSPLPKHWYEPGGAVVENGKLYQLLLLTAEGNNATRIDIATISLPSFKLEGITASKFIDTNTVQTGPQAYPTVWGTTAVQDAKFSYVFGYENTYAGFNGFAHVARIAKGAFSTGNPEYWTGSKWDATSPVLSGRIFGGANLGQLHFSVVSTATGFRAITQGYLSPDLYYWTAPSVDGVWTKKFLTTVKREATEVAANCCPLDYYPTEIPQYESKASKIMLAYLNDGGPDRTSNVKKYRPVFVEGTVS